MDEALDNRPGDSDRAWEEARRVTREERRRRYLETTPAERIEQAFLLSDFAAELRRGLRQDR